MNSSQLKIISILNHKGGVGKTTFTGSTAQALALVGFRVLVIDNDSQHNLSSMLGLAVQSPNIRDVYQSTPQEASRRFLKAIRKTDLPDLHCVTSPSNLCDADVGAIDFLKQCLGACGLERFYDFVLIDNAPGMDRLQASAILACHEIIRPHRTQAIRGRRHRGNGKNAYLKFSQFRKNFQDNS